MPLYFDFVTRTNKHHLSIDQAFFDSQNIIDENNNSVSFFKQLIAYLRLHPDITELSLDLENNEQYESLFPKGEELPWIFVLSQVQYFFFCTPEKNIGQGHKQTEIRGRIIHFYPLCNSKSSELDLLFYKQYNVVKKHLDSNKMPSNVSELLYSNLYVDLVIKLMDFAKANGSDKHLLDQEIDTTSLPNVTSNSEPNILIQGLLANLDEFAKTNDLKKLGEDVDNTFKTSKYDNSNPWLSTIYDALVYVFRKFIDLIDYMGSLATGSSEKRKHYFFDYSNASKLKELKGEFSNAINMLKNLNNPELAPDSSTNSHSPSSLK